MDAMQSGGVFQPDTAPSMAKEEFIRQIEQVLSLEPLALTGTESLRTIEQWDSLAVLGYMALVDQRFGITLDPERVARCKTVEDLFALATE